MYRTIKRNKSRFIQLIITLQRYIGCYLKRIRFCMGNKFPTTKQKEITERENCL